jgi:hypothetical protein
MDGRCMYVCISDYNYIYVCMYIVFSSADSSLHFWGVELHAYLVHVGRRFSFASLLLGLGEELSL